MASRACIVKIGGSLLVDARSYVESARNVLALASRSGCKPIVVVSAARGVTDLLIRASEGDEAALAAAKELYEDIARELGGTLANKVVEELGRLAMIVRAGVRDGATRDLVLSFGERISKLLMVAALEHAGARAVGFNADEILITDERHGDARVDFEMTRALLEKAKHSLEGPDYVSVIEGFVGRARDGSVTTLGRGGSDYTATALGALLGCDVYLVTDVDGVFTADPRLVPSARLVGLMDYGEAYEAALRGAKNTNPKAFEPLLAFPGPDVYVGSWRLMGTRITGKAGEVPEGPKLLTLRGDEITVIGRGMLRSAWASKFLESLETSGADVVEIRGGGSSLSARVRYPGELPKLLALVHDALLPRG
ncbi:MAG: aspartate kinase [Desulfurococcaceae archaeon]